MAAEIPNCHPAIEIEGPHFEGLWKDLILAKSNLAICINGDSIKSFIVEIH